MKKIEQKVRDMQNTVKWSDMYILGVPEGKERENELK